MLHLLRHDDHQRHHDTKQSKQATSNGDTEVGIVANNADDHPNECAQGTQYNQIDDHVGLAGLPTKHKCEILAWPRASFISLESILDVCEITEAFAVVVCFRQQPAVGERPEIDEGSTTLEIWMSSWDNLELGSVRDSQESTMFHSQSTAVLRIWPPLQKRQASSTTL